MKIMNLAYGTIVGGMIGFLVPEIKAVVTDSLFLNPDVLILTVISGAIAGGVITILK